MTNPAAVTMSIGLLSNAQLSAFFVSPLRQFYRDGTTSRRLSGLSHLDNFIVRRKSCPLTGTLQKHMPTPTQTATPHTTGPLGTMRSTALRDPRNKVQTRLFYRDPTTSVHLSGLNAVKTNYRDPLHCGNLPGLLKNHATAKLTAIKPLGRFAQCAPQHLETLVIKYRLKHHLDNFIMKTNIRNIIYP